MRRYCCLGLLIFLGAACSMPRSTPAAPLPVLLPTSTEAPLPLPSPTATPVTPTPDPASSYRPAWGIDYAHPEKYLAQGGQTRLSNPAVVDDLRREQSTYSDPLDMLGRIYWWMKGEFTTWSAGGATIGKATSDQLLAERRLGGCHDWGLAYASLARELGYPTVIVDAVGIAWAGEFQSGKRGPYVGHVFVEVYAGGRWVLIDSTNNWYVASGYDPSNPIIPLGQNPAARQGSYDYYVMRKGLDTWDYGIRDVQSLNKLMEETGRQLDLDALVYPSYQFQRFDR